MGAPSLGYRLLGAQYGLLGSQGCADVPEFDGVETLDVIQD